MAQNPFYCLQMLGKGLCYTDDALNKETVMRIDTSIKGEFNTCLFVGDYFAETGDYPCDKDEAFEVASESADDAVNMATEELKGAGLKNFRAVEAEFVEFDSHNLGHAGAHFNVTIEGATTETIEALFA